MAEVKKTEYCKREKRSGRISRKETLKKETARKGKKTWASLRVLNQFDLPDTFDKFVNKLTKRKNQNFFDGEEGLLNNEAYSRKVSHMMVDLEGNQIETLVCGKGKPMVFLSGIAFTIPVWFQQIRKFSGAFKVISVNSPGHGLSDIIKSVTPSRIADSVIGVLDRLQIYEPVVLCGACFGGLVSQHLVRKYPNRVEKLVLICTASKMPVDDVDYKTIGNLIAQDTNNVQGKTEEQIGVFHDCLKKSVGLKPLPFLCYAEQAFTEKSISFDFLPEIRTPTAVIEGARDTLIYSEDGRILNERLVNSKIFTIEASAHFPMITNPVELNRIISGFVMDH
jgi:pimeloyl-ACP methyl ester carboxylesterase